MRKLFIVVAVGISFFLLLNVSAMSPSLPTWTVQLSTPHDLAPGDMVEESGLRIGQVVEVTPITGGGPGMDTEVRFTLDPDSRDRARERATFVVMKPAGYGRPVLNLVMFDEHSAPLAPGSVIRGADSTTEVELKRQLMVMEGAVRTLTKQLDDLRQTVDKTSRSEERRRLQDSMGGLADSLRQSQNDAVRVLTEEMGRWKKLHDKLFPPEREKPIRFAAEEKGKK